LAPFKRRAAEFCDDLQPGVVLSEGTARGAGLRRLLGQGRYSDIANGMREFAEDRDTQLLIIATLLEKLRGGNRSHVQNRILASTTTNFSLHCALARTIRVHFASADVVRRAIVVMRLLVEKDASNNDLNVPDDVVSYVVWTMLEVMKKFGWHFVRACLVVIRTVTAHCVPQNVQGKVLIQFIANVMQAQLGYTFIVEPGIFLIARCVHKLDMSKEVDRALLLSCDVAKVANVILNCASEHLQTDPYILRTSLDVLSCLANVQYCIMCYIVLQCVAVCCSVLQYLSLPKVRGAYVDIAKGDFVAAACERRSSLRHDSLKCITKICDVTHLHASKHDTHT